ncbi:MAG: PAS domain-containing protein [Draconibacterium sp.]|nr:PAS domain-containing protein [Draconibacterium sp.]
MHNGIALLDSNQKIIQINAAFRKFLNSNETDLIGRTFYLLFQDKMFSDNKTPFERMKTSKTCETSEIEINGRICEIIVDPILDSEVEITGAVLILNDITQRKRDENIQQILHEITGSDLLDKSIEELLFIVRNELGKVIDVTNFFRGTLQT